MGIKERLQNFDKRWSIVNDSSYEEEFNKFKQRVLNIFSDIDSHVSEEGVATFCQILGIREEWVRSFHDDHLVGNNIINALIQESNEKKFYRLLEIISLLPIQTSAGYGGEITHSRSRVFNQLARAIELSNVDLSMVVNGNQIIFHPKGEEKFDKVLVDEVLSFLNPESQGHFVDALTGYLNFSPSNAIKSAESLRRSLEEFLRYKLGNQQGLEKNILELSKKLKTDGRDANIRNTIFSTFSLLNQYFNENSKHRDGEIGEAENEFLIYETGLLMRYVDKSVELVIKRDPGGSREDY